MNTVEQRIWDYLDGTCTSQEAVVIRQLIESDPVFRATYEELQTIDLDLEQLELEDPSMGFSRNVMECIKLEPNPGSIKSLIDKRIINGIAGFFMITILVLLGLVLANTDWSKVSGMGLTDTMKMPDPHQYLNSTVVKGFLFFDLIAGLYFMDSYLRRRSTKH